MQLSGLIHPWVLTPLLLINGYDVNGDHGGKSSKLVLISSHIIQMGETFTGN